MLVLDINIVEKHVSLVCFTHCSPRTKFDMHRYTRKEELENLSPIFKEIERTRNRTRLNETRLSISKKERERESRYLRAESAAAAVDYAPEGLVPSVRQHVPFQPPPRTRTPPLHLATLPLAHEVVAPRLGVDVSYLKIRFQCTINRLHRILSHLAFCPFLRNESSKNRAGLAF